MNIDYINDGNPIDDPEFECPVCGKFSHIEGVCSKQCFKADLL